MYFPLYFPYDSGRLSGERISSRLGIIKSDYAYFPTTRTAQPTPKSDELERGIGGRATIRGFGDSVLVENWVQASCFYLVLVENL